VVRLRRRLRPSTGRQKSLCGLSVARFTKSKQATAPPRPLAGEVFLFAKALRRSEPVRDLRPVVRSQVPQAKAQEDARAAKK
jgi:hypothetical protein